jgi:Zn-dependent protease with chaperone function
MPFITGLKGGMRMQKRLRIIFLFLILIGGIILAVLISIQKIETPYESTFAPLFKVLGITTMSFDRALTRFIPVDALDEAEYGEAIKIRYRSSVEPDDPAYIYLNQLMGQLEHYKKKPFNYEVFPLDYSSPNAFALPGGVICITEGLLVVLETEAQLVGVMAHEMGHIENSHCFDAIRFELLARKVDAESLGYLADLAIQVFLRHSFSKQQEDEADEYAFDMLLNTQYDPRALGEAFTELLKYYEAQGIEEEETANLFRDYFSTHPPIKLRIEKFKEEADLWWEYHREEKRYRGRLNLIHLLPFDEKNFGEVEWAGYEG